MVRVKMNGQNKGVVESEHKVRNERKWKGMSRYPRVSDVLFGISESRGQPRTVRLPHHISRVNFT